MRENRPKYPADSGTVNTMAPRLIAATPKKGAAHRRALLGTCASQAFAPPLSKEQNAQGGQEGELQTRVGRRIRGWPPEAPTVPRTGR